jgi:hypothetical protein
MNIQIFNEEYLIPFKNLLFQFYETIAIEQMSALFICFVLFYIVRSISFIKTEIKEVREDGESVEKLICEIKYSEERVHDRVRDLKQSHKDHFKKISDYIPDYPVLRDRTDEVLNYLSGFEEKVKDSFAGLKKRNKDEIKLLELLRREVQEAREDNASSVQLELPKNVDDIQKEQFIRFNRLEKQIANLDISPIVKMPEINIPPQKDNYEVLKQINDKIERIDKSIYSATILSQSDQIRYSDNTSVSKDFWPKKIEQWLGEQQKLLNQRLKLTENKIIDNMPSDSQTIINTKNESVNIPDFRKLNRDLLLQIEEVVSARLEELNKKILESREISTLEIQRTIDQVKKISTIVTCKLLEVKPAILISSNNSEVLQSIKDLERELKSLKNQVANESVSVISGTLIPDTALTDKISEIERLFKEETKEIKKDIRIVGDDILMRLPLVDKNIVIPLTQSLSLIQSKMESMINVISDIDITIKENQDKVNLMFFSNINELKSHISNFKSDPNLVPILDRINTGFDKIDHNFDKFLTRLSAIPTEGSKYDIYPKSLEEIKHIFEVDIVNQYQEQMIFLELLGAKISELTQNDK